MEIKFKGCDVCTDSRTVGNTASYSLRSWLPAFRAGNKTIVESFLLFTDFETDLEDEDFAEIQIWTDLTIGKTKYPDEFSRRVKFQGKRFSLKSGWCGLAFEPTDATKFEEGKYWRATHCLSVECFLQNADAKRISIGRYDIQVHEKA